MYTVHTSALPFKDNLLESQVPTWALTFACTSDQFRSSCNSGPNHTPRMRTGPSLQREGSWKGIATRPGTEPQTFAFVKIDLGTCYSFILGIASMSKRQDIKTVISSASAKTFAVRGPAKGLPCRVGFDPSSLKPSEQGLQS